MRVVALVMAKRESRRLPNKNLLDLGGAPLFVHSIRAGLRADRVGEVTVSTDDDEIAEVARAAGARVVRRGADLCGPHVNQFPVLLHALDRLRPTPDVCVLLQPTHPFRDPRELDAMLERLEATPEASSLIAVAPVASKSGPVDAEGWFTRAEAFAERPPPQFVNTGQVYAFRVAASLARGNWFGDRILAWELARPDLEIDIDYPWDLEIARTMLERHPDRDRLLPPG